MAVSFSISTMYHMMNCLSIPLQRATKIRLRCSSIGAHHRHFSSSSTSSASDSEEPPANSATILQGPSLLASTGNSAFVFY